MNFKQYILPLTLALITTWAIQYFFINRNSQAAQGSAVQSGQTFIAPASALQAQPLNKTIEFVDSDVNAQGAQTVIQTASGQYVFSSQGGCLSQLTFKRVVDGKEQEMRTINPSGDNACNFLVALNTKTPLRYMLVEQKRLEAAHKITYKAETDQAIIQKQYIVHDNKMQIDLDLTITPKQGSTQARIFFGSPVTLDINQDGQAIMPKLEDPYNITSGIYNSQKGSVQKESIAKIDLNKGWFAPTFFGSENRYFVHAMIADQNGFAQRAYYSVVGKQLVSILESATITQPTSWNLSFYVGPKEDAAMGIVDPRLEQTLEHSGLLAPLSRFLLMILNFLYQYVHNYGWAIVLMTILINLVLLPLNVRSAKSLKKYGEFQKKLAYIQARYKDDPEALARERADLINKHGMPGLGGCLPKLLQLPIFFALSRVLSGSFELYHAPFLWMKDLSAKDPYYILPILIVIFMIVQANATDPKQRFMVIGIALVFGAAAANFSAGLSLYILVGVVLNGLQMYLQNKFGWA